MRMHTSRRSEDRINPFHREYCMKNTKHILAVFILVNSLLSLHAQNEDNTKKVVASTTWTAAIAYAGGARNISIIAPVDLKHPPEYEIKPSDLEKVREAELVVYAGYEKFASRLAETSGVYGARIVEVFTDNVPPVFKREAMKVAEALGTMDAFRTWEKEFDVQMDAMKTAIDTAYPDKRAVVHQYLSVYAEWLGFDVVGTFGPGEITPQRLLNLVRLKPALIIDNWHNISGLPLAESLDCSYVELINFPGHGGTESIMDVFAYNRDQFLEAAQ